MQEPAISCDDRLAVHELLARYGDIVDARDWPQLAEVFTEDAVFDVTDIGAARLEGLAAIDAFMRGDAEHPLAHLITNIHVADGPGGEIQGHSRLLAVLPDGRALTGDYSDVLVRTQGGWRIASRRFQLRRPEKRD